MSFFPFYPDLAKKTKVSYRFETGIERGQQGGEVRKALAAQMLRDISLAWFLEAEELQKARKFFDVLDSDLVQLPDWSNSSVILTGSSGGTSTTVKTGCFRARDWMVKQIYFYDIKNNVGQLATISDVTTSGAITITETLTSDVAGWLALPVRSGRFLRVPDWKGLGDRRAEFKLSFSERSESFQDQPSTPDLPADPITYESRPVWLKLWNETDEGWNDNLRETKVGFGPDIATKQADEAKRKLSFTVDLHGHAEVKEMLDFWESRQGRASSLWVPSYRSSFKSIADIPSGATSFQVKATDLPSLISERSGYGRLALLSGGRYHFAEVATVSTVDTETELITITEAVTGDFSAERTTICPLMASRFGADRLDVEFFHPGEATTAVSFVELPKEYAAPVVAVHPAYIYEFTGYFSARYTGHGKDLVSDGETFTSQPITHGVLAYRAQSIRSKLDVTFSPLETAHPLLIFRKGYPVEPMKITVWEIDTATPDTRRMIYQASVRKLTYAENATIGLSLGSAGDAAETDLPTAYIEPRCSRKFLATGCNLDASNYRITGTVATISANTITSTAFGAEATSQGFADWLLGGQVKIGDEKRTIIAHAGDSVTVSTPFVLAVDGDTLTALPGCNRTQNYCKNRFDNFNNYGGAPFVPPSNPALEAVRFNSDIPTGGKK